MLTSSSPWLQNFKHMRTYRFINEDSESASAETASKRGVLQTLL